MTFESEGLLIVAIYTWLPPASYVVFSDNSGYLGVSIQYLQRVWHANSWSSPLMKHGPVPHQDLHVF